MSNERFNLEHKDVFISWNDNDDDEKLKEEIVNLFDLCEVKKYIKEGNALALSVYNSDRDTHYNFRTECIQSAKIANVLIFILSEESIKNSKMMNLEIKAFQEKDDSDFLSGGDLAIGVLNGIDIARAKELLKEKSLNNNEVDAISYYLDNISCVILYEKNKLFDDAKKNILTKTFSNYRYSKLLHIKKLITSNVRDFGYEKKDSLEIKLIDRENVSKQINDEHSKYKYFILTGISGIGKTSYLKQFTKMKNESKDEIAFYLTATKDLFNDINNHKEKDVIDYYLKNICSYENEQEICDLKTYIEGCSEITHRWIIIDGLDEIYLLEDEKKNFYNNLKKYVTDFNSSTLILSSRTLDSVVSYNFEYTSKKLCEIELKNFNKNEAVTYINGIESLDKSNTKIIKNKDKIINKMESLYDVTPINFCQQIVLFIDGYENAFELNFYDTYDRYYSIGDDIENKEIIIEILKNYAYDSITNKDYVDFDDYISKKNYKVEDINEVKKYLVNRLIFENIDKDKVDFKNKRVRSFYCSKYFNNGGDFKKFFEENLDKPYFHDALYFYSFNKNKEKDIANLIESKYIYSNGYIDNVWLNFIEQNDLDSNNMLISITIEVLLKMIAKNDCYDCYFNGIIYLLAKYNFYEKFFQKIYDRNIRKEELIKAIELTTVLFGKPYKYDKYYKKFKTYEIRNNSDFYSKETIYEVKKYCCLKTNDSKNNEQFNNIKPLGILYSDNIEKLENIDLNNIVALFIDCENSDYKSIPEDFLLNNKSIRFVYLRGIHSVGEKAFFNCSNLKYIYIESDNKLNFDQEAFSYCRSLEIFKCSGEVEKLNDSLFEGCIVLNYVCINGVKEIGVNAFNECLELTSINDFDCVKIENIEKLGVGSFRDCNKIKNVILSEKVEVIPDSCFENCENLSEIKSNKIKSIGKNAFSKTKLTDINSLISNALYINDYAFKECKNISNVEFYGSYIGVESFFKCEKLEEINLYNTINISQFCFENCRNLKKVSIHGGKKLTIGANAFSHNKALNKVDIISKGDLLIGEYAFILSDQLEVVSLVSNKLLTIKNNSFYICPSLIRVYIHSGNLIIKKNAFGKCYSLNVLELDSNTKYIEEYAFSFTKNLSNIRGITDFTGFEENSLYHSNINDAPCNLVNEDKKNEIIIDDNILSNFTSEINNFDSCIIKSREIFQNNKLSLKFSPIQKLSFKDDITIIPDLSFEGCDLLSYIKFPNSLEKIGKSAFSSYNSSKLEHLEFPKSLKEISEYAFNNCKKLKTLIFNSIPNVSNNSFKNCSLQNLNFNGDMTEKDIKEFLKSDSFKNSNVLLNNKNITFNINKQDTLYLPYNKCFITNNLNNKYKDYETFVIKDSELICNYHIQQLRKCTEIIIDKSFKMIYNSAFSQFNVETIIFLGNNYKLGKYAFYECKKLKNINLEKCKKIGSSCFKECDSLTNVLFSKELDVIEDNAFRKCNKLERLNFNVTSKLEIKGSAFAECGNLESLEIKADSLKIKKYAFENCKRLKNIYISCATLIDKSSIDSDSFIECKAINSIDISSIFTFIIRPNAFEQDFKIKNLKLNGKIEFDSSSIPYAEGELELDDDICSKIMIPSRDKNNKLVYVLKDNKFNFWKLTLTRNFHNYEYLSSFKNHSHIKEIIVEGEISELPDGAFQDLSFEKIILPKTLKKIGANSFSYNNAIEEIEFPKGLLEIGEYAFENCKKLSIVKIPSTVKILKNYCFHNCYNLSFIELDDGLVEIGSFALSYTGLRNVILPKTISKIGDNVFSNSLLEKIDLSRTKIEKINQYEFSNDVFLKEIKFPIILVEIGANAFSNTPNLSLKDIKIPNTLKILGDECFKNSGIENINISHNLDSIGANAFSNTYNLTSININNVTIMKNSVFENSSIKSAVIRINELPKKTFSNCKKLESIKLVNCIKICDEAFKNCSKLDFNESSGLESITYIGKRAFKGCENIKYLNFESATTIEASAFSQNIILERIELNSVKSLNCNVFFDCKNLSKIYLDNCTQIGDDVFKKLPSLSEIHFNNKVKFSHNCFINCQDCKSVDIIISSIDEKDIDNIQNDLNKNKIKAKVKSSDWW